MGAKDKHARDMNKLQRHLGEWKAGTPRKSAGEPVAGGERPKNDGIGAPRGKTPSEQLTNNKIKYRRKRHAWRP